VGGGGAGVCGCRINRNMRVCRRHPLTLLCLVVGQTRLQLLANALSLGHSMNLLTHKVPYLARAPGPWSNICPAPGQTSALLSGQTCGQTPTLRASPATPSMWIQRTLAQRGRRRPNSCSRVEGVRPGGRGEGGGGRGGGM
jgi:hypothetical protein